MPVVYSDAGFSSEVSRSIVKALFVASCLLSVVSWYTTQQGMALYLSPWFAFMASLGIQSALVLTAWLTGFTRTRRGLLITVYVVTAIVSIAFSYVSLYTWFSARERPALIERRLYDALTDAAGKVDSLQVAAASEAQKHVLALDEMTAAEKASGYISRAQDADPYLGRVREAVAREAQTYNPLYKEGTGAGLRYTAFDRYTKLARQSLDRIQESQSKLGGWRAQRKPQDASEKQLRDFEQAYAAVPWMEIDQALHRGNLEKPAMPAFSDFVDKTVSGQEDLLVAFQELARSAGGRPLFSLALAAFLDVVIFLLAYAAGPLFAGPAVERWRRAAAALDSADPQVFLRGFLRKVSPDAAGGARVEVDSLTSGESQLCLALASQGQAVMAAGEGRRYYLLEETTHQALLDAMASPSFPLKAAQRAAATG